MDPTALSESRPDLEKLVKLVISDITALKQDAKLKFALGVAEIVVQRFFGGDWRAMRRRGPKDVAICRLAQHPELPISVSSLYVALQVYEVAQRLGNIDSNNVLCMMHYRAVLAAPPDIQKRLLQQAAEKAWSASRLRREIVSSLPAGKAECATRTDDSAVHARRLGVLARQAAHAAQLDADEVAAALDRDALEALLLTLRKVTSLVNASLERRALPEDPGPAR